MCALHFQHVRESLAYKIVVVIVFRETYTIRKCDSCKSSTFSVNRISFSLRFISLSLFHVLSIFFLVASGLNRIRIKSKSVAWKKSNVRFGFAVAQLMSGIPIPGIRRTWHTFSVSVLISQMSYAQHSESIFFSLSLRSDRNIHLAIHFVSCNHLSFLCSSLAQGVCLFVSESQLCRFAIVFT